MFHIMYVKKRYKSNTNQLHCVNMNYIYVRFIFESKYYFRQFFIISLQTGLGCLLPGQ